jgi:hypothetical protein
MVRQTDLVIIGICVGLALGILISCLIFFGIRWCKKRSHLTRSASEPSLTTLPIRTNGFEASTDFSASITSSIGTSGSDNTQKNSHFTWWNHQNKDRFASASGILKYSYKYVYFALNHDVKSFFLISKLIFQLLISKYIDYLICEIRSLY